jgi:hypothetical protein
VARAVSKKIGDWFFPELLASYRFEKLCYVPERYIYIYSSKENSNYTLLSAGT